MEISNENFRAYVYIEFQRQIKPAEIYQQLCEAGLPHIPCQATVFNWCKEFREGTRQNLHDAPRSGRPRSSTSDPVVTAVKDAIFAAPQLSTRQLADLLGLTHSSVHRILTEELLLRKVCSVWVPHNLTEANKKQRVEGATAMKAFFNHHSEEELMSRYVTEDETWVLFNDLKPKAENMVWLAPGQPRPQVVRPQLTWEKTMVILAFTCNKKFSVDVTQRSETVDADRYLNFVHQTGEKWRKLRSDPVRLRDLWWQQDNARPHTSRKVQEFFARRGVQRIEQPPYSPDLNLCDRFLFKLLKKELREASYSAADEVKAASLQALRSTPEERFLVELKRLREHCERVIESEGDYVTN